MNSTMKYMGLLLCGLLTTSACDRPEQANHPPGDAVEPQLGADGTYVSLSGTVAAADAHGFTLDYGPGVVTVEMDDWDWLPEGNALMANDQVIVYGYVDKDFYSKRKIEASSVYVADLGTQFYASGADEEEFPVMGVVEIAPRIQLVGTVQEINGDELVLKTSGGVVDVNVQNVPYNLFDDQGYQRIAPGDRVSVSGTPQPKLFTDFDLTADSIVTLQNNAGSSKQG